ncbi:MAG TPA: hypothetical protein VG097_14730 [Gemmata sp.]|jgi:hypothetical protein|nr:hypothetical protein [Gemmata sp.]
MFVFRDMLSFMTNSTRQELLAVLANLSTVCPEMRFGQLIANLSTLARGLSEGGLWDVEDEELLAAAQKQLAYFVEHRPLDQSLAPNSSVGVG